MKISLTEDECDLIIQGLCMKSNIMQTGSPLYNATDVRNAKGNIGPRIRALDTDQMRTIVIIDDLIKKIRECHQ